MGPTQFDEMMRLLRVIASTLNRMELQLLRGGSENVDEPETREVEDGETDSII